MGRGPSLSPLRAAKGRRGAISGELAVAQFRTPTTGFGRATSIMCRSLDLLSVMSHYTVDKAEIENDRS